MNMIKREKKPQEKVPEEDEVLWLGKKKRVE